MIIEYLKTIKQLTPAEVSIRHYIVENPGSVVNLTIRDLAMVCNVSVASINRLCIKLGFEGYTDFKVSYIKEYKDVERMQAFNRPIPFDQNSTYRDVVEYIPYVYEKTINYMKMSMDPDVMMRCISLMRDAHIMVFGTGLNKSLADIFVYKVQELGIECSAHDSLHFQFVEALKHRKRKVFAILITHSGVNKIIVTVAKRLYQNKIPNLLISGVNVDQLTQYCPNQIIMPQTGSTLDYSNTQYMIATQYVLDTIMSLLLIEHYDVVQQVSSVTRNDQWTGD